MKLSDLATLRLSYSDVGAPAGPLPDGYHHVRKSAVIGRGRPRFEEAAAKVYAGVEDPLTQEDVAE